jgi:hypothetical protein
VTAIVRHEMFITYHADHPIRSWLVVQFTHQHLKPTWHQSGRTIGMAMGNQHGVDLSQSILWEPLDGGRLEVFANVDNNGPEKCGPS